MIRAVVVTGGRDFNDLDFFRVHLGRLRPHLLYHGGARGADLAADAVARDAGCIVRQFDADWTPKPNRPVGYTKAGRAYNKLAGFDRNEEMMAAAAALPLELMCLAAPGGSGTVDAVARAAKHGIPVWRPAVEDTPPQWRPPVNVPLDAPPLSLDEGSSVRSYTTPLGPLPSVTAILDRTTPPKLARSLAEWEARVGREEAARVREIALERGDVIHDIIEKQLRADRHHDKPTTIDFRSTHLHEDDFLPFYRSIYPEIERLLRWGRPVMIEQSVWHPEAGFAGTVDAVWRTGDGEYVIADWKTSGKRRAPSSEYGIQIAAYAAAVRRIYGLPISRGIVLAAVGDGGPAKRMVLSKEELVERWGVFLERLKLMRSTIPIGR